MSIYLSQKAFPCLWQIYLSFPVICLHFLRSRNHKDVCSNSRIIAFSSLSRSLDSWRIALLSFCSASWSWRRSINSLPTVRLRTLTSWFLSRTASIFSEFSRARWMSFCWLIICSLRDWRIFFVSSSAFTPSKPFTASKWLSFRVLISSWSA